MYGAELHIRSAPHAEIKSEADDRAFFEPDQASKTDALVFVRALDSGGLIRVNWRARRPCSGSTLIQHVLSPMADGRADPRRKDPGVSPRVLG